jgi:membrane fusion protein (multidrug efflux system)
MSEIVNAPLPQASSPQTANQHSINQSPAPDVRTEAKHQKLFPRLVMLAIMVALIVGGIYYFTVYRYFQSTDNAYVKADVTWVIPRVSGEITALLVNDNQVVKAGQVLMKLDDRDTQARYAQAEAMVGVKEAALGVQKQNEIAAQASIAQARAGSDATHAEVIRLKKDFDRYQTLLHDGVTTRQQLETVQAQYSSAIAQQASAAAAVASATAQAESVRASRAQMNADLKSSEANVQLVGVDTSSAEVIAPISGTVSSFAVRLGSRVNPQTRMMAIVPLADAYIEANFKETQIGKMKVGQTVKLTFDAYQGQVFHGHIQSFSPASGATFSLMPPDNATGNFNKVVQRIPVRIVIDDMPNRQKLRPGLSVTAEVDLRS